MCRYVYIETFITNFIIIMINCNHYLLLMYNPIPTTLQTMSDSGIVLRGEGVVRQGVVWLYMYANEYKYTNEHDANEYEIRMSIKHDNEK